MLDLILKSGRELESARSCLRTSKERLADLVSSASYRTSKRLTTYERQEMISSKIVRVLGSLRSCQMNLQNALGVPFEDPNVSIGTRLKNTKPDLETVAVEVLKIEREIEVVLDSLLKFARKHQIDELPKGSYKLAEKYRFSRPSNTPSMLNPESHELAHTRPALDVLRR